MIMFTQVAVTRITRLAVATGDKRAEFIASVIQSIVSQTLVSVAGTAPTVPQNSHSHQV